MITNVGECIFKNKAINIGRDQHGKFFVSVDGIETQKRLKASEIVRYLLNAMNER